MLRKRFGRILCTLLTLTMLLSLVPASAVGVEPADSVYRNGKVYTVNEAFDVVTAIAVKGDRLVYVGDEAGVEAYIGSGTKVVDLGGKAVIPGLIESHMHVDKYGFKLQNVDIYWKPKDVILQMVAEVAADAGPGVWITASGWNEAVWPEGTYPTKEDLDAVAPDNPVLLGRYCGHMAWANSLAFELAGITPDTPSPQGGEILHNEDGSIQGCVTDTAWGMISAAIPDEDLTPEQEEAKLADAMMKAQDTLFSLGITSAMDAGVSVQRIESYKKLYENGKLKLRLYPLLRLESMDSEMAEYLKNNPVNTNEQYDNHLLVRCVKLFADGALGARGAWFLEDYSDRPGHKGEYRHTDEEMDELVALAYNQGYQIATHAIGDAAVHQTINAYEKALKAAPRDDHRLRIEHFQIVKPDDIDRALDLDIIPAMQFIHATSDMLMAEDRVGPERIKTAYAWRTVLDKGSIIPGGTDAPFDRVNPYHCMYAGITRTGLNGSPEGGWYPEQCITREEALRSYTNWSAYAHFEEDLKGSLEVGKLADFAVLDRDIMTCPEEDIKDTQVLTTVSGGEVVFTRDNAQPTVVWQGEALDVYSPFHVEPGVVYAPLNDVVNGIAATVTRDGTKASVTVDGKTAQVEVKTVNGVEYVGVRALFEGLGRNVTWYGLSSCISVGWPK